MRKTTDEQKRWFESTPTKGYWSALGGVEVKKLEHRDMEDYVYCISNAWGNQHEYHILKVQFTHSKNPRPYIRLFEVKLYLDECLRT